MDDNSTFTVRVGNCNMQINTGAFFDTAKLCNIVKLFRILSEHAYIDANDASIKALDAYLPAKLADVKEQWARANRTYKDTYICTESRYDLTKQQKNKIEQMNKRIFKPVKACKTRYDRYVRILSEFEKRIPSYERKGE